MVVHRRRRRRARHRGRPGEPLPRGRRRPASSASATAGLQSPPTTPPALERPRRSARSTSSPAEVGAGRRRPARSRPSSSRSSTCATAQPRGYEGLVRPLPGSGFADPSELFAAAEAVGRTVELDLACLATVDRRLRHARPAGQPDPQRLAADARVGRLQRPRPRRSCCSRHGVDPDARRPRADRARGRRGHGPPASGRSKRAGPPGMRIAADDVGAGNAGLRLLSPAPVRHRQDRPVARPGRRRPGDLPGGRPHAQGPRRPLGRARHRRGRRDPRAARVRALARASAPVRATCSAGRRETPATDAVDLDAPASSSGDWLVDRLRPTPA